MTVYPRSMPRARLLWIAIPAALVGIGVGCTTQLATMGPDPLEVVENFTTSRNAGDVDLAMSYLADDTRLFDASMATERGQAKIRDILAAQAVAEWTIQESSCSADGDQVTCRYQMDDIILRRWGLSFFGRHEYVIEDGKVARLLRFHDKESREEAYAALADFKEWVRQTHRDLLYVIWSDAQSVTYATPEGAAAMLDLLDEYSPP
jgi:limonene-1,2-epoxide hydrolase